MNEQNKFRHTLLDVLAELDERRKKRIEFVKENGEPNEENLWHNTVTRETHSFSGHYQPITNPILKQSVPSESFPDWEVYRNQDNGNDMKITLNANKPPLESTKDALRILESMKEEDCIYLNFFDICLEVRVNQTTIPERIEQLYNFTKNLLNE